MELQSRGARTKEVHGVENTGNEEGNNGASKAVSEHSLPFLNGKLKKTSWQKAWQRPISGDQENKLNIRAA